MSHKDSWADLPENTQSHLVFSTTSQRVNCFTPAVSAQALMSHIQNWTHNPVTESYQLINIFFKKGKKPRRNAHIYLQQGGAFACLCLLDVCLLVSSLATTVFGQIVLIFVV